MSDKFYKATPYPQTQNHATYNQNGSPSPIGEPTLALYCLIEGGDCVVGERKRTREKGRSGRRSAARLDVFVRVRLPPLVCAFIHYMRLTQPQVNSPSFSFPDFFIVVFFEVFRICHGGRRRFLPPEPIPCCPGDRSRRGAPDRRKPSWWSEYRWDHSVNTQVAS